MRFGALFPELAWSKSGAALFRDHPPHYLIWGDSTLAPGLHVATSSDGLSWQQLPGLLLGTRSTFFDSHLVESGPPPLRLRSGHYLFLYNSARSGFPSVKPGYDLQCSSVRGGGG